MTDWYEGEIRMSMGWQLFVLLDEGLAGCLNGLSCAGLDYFRSTG